MGKKKSKQINKGSMMNTQRRMQENEISPKGQLKNQQLKFKKNNQAATFLAFDKRGKAQTQTKTTSPSMNLNKATKAEVF